MSPARVGRYALYGSIASGGMATVHFGRLRASGGFSRIVAIKRLHENYSNQPEFAARFLDEARLAARIRHPNVVPTLDVVARGHELFLVMEYVSGESLGRLLARQTKLEQRTPLRIASAIMTSLLRGLHDAHEARSETGAPLRIVHRDVSPQNVIVGTDGIVRILDFGIAKAVDRAQSTKDGTLRGKVSYMSPEQLLDAGVDRLTDVYAASVVFWELLTGERMHGDADIPMIAARVMKGDTPPLPSTRREDIPTELEALVMRGLSHDAALRPPSALAMAEELESIVEPASAARVADWMKALAKEALESRAALVSKIERGEIEPETFDEDGDGSSDVDALAPRVPASRAPVPPETEPKIETVSAVLVEPPPAVTRLRWVLGVLVVIAFAALGVALNLLKNLGTREASAAAPAASSPPATIAVAPAPSSAPREPASAPASASVTPQPIATSTAVASTATHRSRTHAAAPTTSITAPAEVDSAVPTASVAPPPEPTDSLYRTRR